MVETPSPRVLRSFGRLWAHAAQVTVATALVVEAIDVVGDIVQGELSVLVDLLS